MEREICTAKFKIFQTNTSIGREIRSRGGFVYAEVLQMRASLGKNREDATGGQSNETERDQA